MTVDAPRTRPARPVAQRERPRVVAARPHRGRDVRHPAAPAGVVPTQNVAAGPVAEPRPGGGTPAAAIGLVPKTSAGGTKTNTPLVETPQSISVVTREQLDELNPQTVSQALRYTPGVTSDYRGAVNRFDVIYLRGISSGFYNEHLDGLKLLTGINYAIPQIDPYDLERIEILRGPASVLYGQNDPGGILNMVSKRPTEKAFGEVQLQAGSFNRVQGAFDIGGPVDKDGHLLYRVTGLARDANTQIDHTKEQRLSLSPSFTWRPDGATSLTVLGNVQRDPSEGSFGFFPAQGTFLPNPRAGKISPSFYDGDPNFDTFHRTQASIGYAFEHRFDDWLFRQNFRYQNIGVDLGRVASTGLQADLVTLNRRTITSYEVLNAITFDNQLERHFRTGPLDHTALFGIDYQKTLSSDVLGSAVAPTLNILNPVYYRIITAPPTIQNTAQDISQVGTYAQDQARFGNLIAVVSGRHDWADETTRDRLANTSAIQHDQAFTGRAGLVYLFDNGIAPYGSYSTSFNPTAGTGFNGTPFRPTTGEQYEVGVKYQPVGINALITVAAFDLRQQNVLTPDPDTTHVCAGATCSVQTGEVRSRGIELEGKASLSEGWNLLGAFTHIDPRVTRSNTTNLGKRPVAIPSDTASVWADYTFHFGPLAGFGLGGGVRYVGTTAGDSANIYTVPAATLFDAAIHYDLGALDRRFKGLSLQVNANNIFDHQYISSCSNAPIACYYGLRRTVIGTLTYRW